jgi:hypothetical protein
MIDWSTVKTRHLLAAVAASVAVPASYAVVMAAYVGGDPFEAVPLLPAHLGAVALFAFWITFIGGLPLWLLVSRRRAISFAAAALSGATIGFVAAVFFFALDSNTLLPIAVVLSTAVCGGTLAAVVFRAIVGGRPDRPWQPASSRDAQAG